MATFVVVEAIKLRDRAIFPYCIKVSKGRTVYSSRPFNSVVLYMQRRKDHVEYIRFFTNFIVFMLIEYLTQITKSERLNLNGQRFAIDYFNP